MVKNLLVAASLVVGLAAFVLHFYNPVTSKTAYVDTGRIYTEFTLSKELNSELESMVKLKKRGLDSLYYLIQSQAKEVGRGSKPKQEEIQRISRLEEEYVYRQKQFEKENQELSVNYNNKIWNQVNQFVEDYGRLHGLSFILGATGEGTIMYGDKGTDITEMLIQYINERYAGKNK